FHAPGGPADAALMTQKGSFPYLEGPSVQAVELPYRDGQLALVVLLPRRADGLAALEKMLTPARLAGWLKGLRKRELHVTLPRFKVGSSFQLRTALTALGMPVAF